MATASPTSKRQSPAPVLIGREGELEWIRTLLNASGAFVPLLLGRSGSGKTALLQSLAASCPPTGTAHLNATQCLESFTSLTRKKCLLVDNLHRMELAQIAHFLDWLDPWRVVKGRSAILSYDSDMDMESFSALLQKYRFVKPIHLTPLSWTSTAQVLEQFASSRGVAAPRTSLMQLVSIASDFFPTRALPGSAVDCLDWIISAANKKDLSSGRVWTTDMLMGQLEKLSGLPRKLIECPLAERIGSFPSDNVGLLDQLRLSQAARAIAGLLSVRLIKNAGRRKPLGSFILAGINPVRAHEFARAYVEHCHGQTGAVVRVLLKGRVRQETPEIFARIREELRGKSGGVVVMEDIAEATPRYLETLETILEEGHGSSLARVIFLFPTTVGESLMSNPGFLPSQLHKAVIREVKTQLPPSLWRRVDDIHIPDIE